MEDDRLSVAREFGPAELSRAQGRALFDERARRTLGITGDEFLCRWDAGQYNGVDDPDVVSLAMLIPFARAELTP